MQRDQLVRRRPLVHAVERDVLVFGQELRGADVGRQHAFLDQLVGVVARRRHDARDLAVLVELQRQLDGVEVDCAALGSGRGKRVV